jgi:hypothetical protein
MKPKRSLVNFLELAHRGSHPIQKATLKLLSI